MSIFHNKFFNIDGDILELRLIDTYEGMPKQRIYVRVND